MLTFHETKVAKEKLYGGKKTYKNLKSYRLGKACFGYDRSHPDSKYLSKRTVCRKQGQEQ